MKSLVTIYTSYWIGVAVYITKGIQYKSGNPPLYIILVKHCCQGDHVIKYISNQCLSVGHAVPYMAIVSIIYNQGCIAIATCSIQILFV